MDERDRMRVSDAERQAAADRLRAAMAEGRLDLLEYDNRLARAYASVTYGDLDGLFADLPAGTGAVAPHQPASAAPAPVRPAVPAPRPAPHVPTALKVLWTVWLAVVSINLTVWLLVGIGNGDAEYFWPMWLLVPGAALFGVTVAVMSARRGR
jgi:hypothetical protein